MLIIPITMFGCKNESPTAVKPAPATPVIASTEESPKPKDESPVAAQSVEPAKATESLLPAEANSSELVATTTSPPQEKSAAGLSDPPAPLPAGRLLLLLPKGLLIVDMFATLDGRPLGASLDELIAEILKGADANQDNHATWDELLTLPRIASGALGNERVGNEQQRRQMIQQFDWNRDKTVSTQELARFLGRDGGTRPFSLKATHATWDEQQRESPVRRLLDTDGDGQLSADEMNAAAARLRSRDANDDELIVPADLKVVEATPPGMEPRRKAWGAEPAFLLTAKTDWLLVLGALAEAYSNQDRLMAEAFRYDTWLFKTLDADDNGVVTKKELEKLRDVEPHLHVTARLGNNASPTESNRQLTWELKREPWSNFQVQVDPLAERFTFSFAEGALAWQLAEVAADNSQARTDALLAQYDADKNGYLEKDELPEEAVAGLAEFTALDANGDEKLFPEEILAFLRQQQGIATRQVRAHFRQVEDALFAALDTNRDGRLDWREIDAAPQQLRQLDQDQNGTLDMYELPTGAVVTVTRGGPTDDANLTAAPIASKPAEPTANNAPARWFQNMDTNGDSAISVREFLGEAETFQQLDTNRDGFLEWSEVGKLEGEKSE